MDHSARCRAMAAFCKQRARMEDENEAFWLSEAVAWTAKLRPRLRLVSPKLDIASIKPIMRADGPMSATGQIDIDLSNTSDRPWTRLPPRSNDAH